MRMMLLGASLLLAGCVQSGEGCATYGMQRASMPSLGADGLSAWVATTDTAMTRACRG